ncbi:MAG TPA: dipeptide epimerase, partial [Alphaproteobacteria bacterium]|nr:dipeptide epimerase [Alphaproteobacteria bacterium]
MRKLHIEIETWPVDGSFVIARGAKSEAVVVVAKLSSAGFIGLGECVPYARYEETPEQTTALIEQVRPSIEAGASRSALQTLLPPGAARNAVDCALWDLEAKQARARVWTLAGLPEPQAAPTAKTISVGTPQAMAAAARRFPDSALLKVKLTGDGDDARITAVRAAAPRAR